MVSVSTKSNTSVFKIGGEETDAYFPLLYLPRSEVRGRAKCASYSHTWNDKRGEKIFIAVIYDLATRSVVDSWASQKGLAAQARDSRLYTSVSKQNFNLSHFAEVLSSAKRLVLG